MSASASTSAIVGVLLATALGALPFRALAMPPEPQRSKTSLPTPQSQEEASGVPRITINKVPLKPQDARALVNSGFSPKQYGNELWYDRVSGLWGVWGGPALGQVEPNLPVEGPLPFEASGGQTAVVVNGRALHPSEVQQLIATYGQAIPGRYTLDAMGNVGIEGGPRIGNIHAPAPGPNGIPSWHNGPAGSVSNDGNCTIIHPKGGDPLLTGPNC